MAKKAKNSKKPNIPKGNIQKMLEAYKIRGCKVRLLRLNVTNSVQYENALLHKYDIRDCFVRIERLNDTKIPEKKKLLSTRKIGSIRKQVSWLPSKSSTEINSAAAISSLAAYQNNAVASSSEQSKPKPSLAKRQRAISMYAERANELIKARKMELTMPFVGTSTQNHQKESTAQNAAKRQKRITSMYADTAPRLGKTVTMEEMHVEFLAKCCEPNRGLKSGSERQLAGVKSQQPPVWKNIFEEFQAKYAAKKAKKTE